MATRDRQQTSLPPRKGMAMKGLKQIAAAEFVNAKLSEAARKGSLVVILREGGRVTPDSLAGAARKRGFLTEITGQRVTIARQKQAQAA